MQKLYFPFHFQVKIYSINCKINKKIYKKRGKGKDAVCENELMPFVNKILDERICLIHVCNPTSFFHFVSDRLVLIEMSFKTSAPAARHWCYSTCVLQVAAPAHVLMCVCVCRHIQTYIYIHTCVTSFKYTIIRLSQTLKTLMEVTKRSKLCNWMCFSWFQKYYTYLSQL